MQEFGGNAGLKFVVQQAPPRRGLHLDALRQCRTWVPPGANRLRTSPWCCHRTEPPDLLLQKFRRVYGLIARARRRRLLLTLLMMLCGAAAEMLTVGAVLPTLALAADPETDLVPPGIRHLLALVGGTALIGAAVLLASAAIVASIVRLSLVRTSERLIAEVGHDLTMAVFSRTLHQPFEAHLRRGSSEVLAGIEKVQAIISGFLQPAMQALIAAILGVAIALFLFALHPLAAGVCFAVVLAAYWVMHRLTHRRVGANSRVLAEAMNDRTRIVLEGLGGIRDIILEQSHDLFQDRLRHVDNRYRQASATNRMTAASPRFVIEAVGITAIAVVTVTMSLKPGELAAAIPVLGALALGGQRLFPLVQQVWHGWSTATGHLQSVADVAAILEAPLDQSRPATAPLSFEDAIVADRLSFAYEGRARTIHDIRLRIAKGERIGITGTTGSGKSTFLDLLMGLLKPSSGAIQIDGIPLDEGTRSAWRAAIAHVPQSIFLADSSIADNIAFGSKEPLDMERLLVVAKAACVHDFVSLLPAGYDTQVGERGVRLSGGQRQRIGIARALYKRAQLLVLDEATSALDEETEARVMRSIAALPDSLTVVMVAHRRSTLELCNRVLQLENGRIAALLSSQPTAPG